MKKAVVARYLLRQFFLRLFFVTLALTGILLVFDLLGNIVAVTTGHKHIIEPVLYYIWLRLPSIMLLAIPVSVLVAAMITMARLVVSQEMTALSASGMTIYAVILILTAGAVVPALMQLTLSNEIVPPTVARLNAWEKLNYQGHPPKQGQVKLPAWFVAGHDLIRVTKASTNGQVLYNVIIIRRNPQRLIALYIAADQMNYMTTENGSYWHLRNVSTKDMKNNGYSVVPAQDIDIALKPEALSIIGGDATTMSLPMLVRIIHDPQNASEPKRVYRMWIQRKIAEPIESLIMILLAAPIGLQVSRRNNIFSLSFGIIACGFLYFIAERLLLTMGETGQLPPVIAVWGPSLIFAMTGIWYLLHKQEGRTVKAATTTT